jgi:hypothetical protein
VSRDSQAVAFSPTDVQLECSSCSEKKLVWLWLRHPDAKWDSLCFNCSTVIVVWATASGVQVMADSEGA